MQDLSSQTAPHFITTTVWLWGSFCSASRFLSKAPPTGKPTCSLCCTNIILETLTKKNNNNNNQLWKMWTASSSSNLILFWYYVLFRKMFYIKSNKKNVILTVVKKKLSYCCTVSLYEFKPMQCDIMLIYVYLIRAILCNKKGFM